MSEEKKFYVYVHRYASGPKEGQVFYVGKGKGNRVSVSFGRNRHWKSIVDKYGYTFEVVYLFTDEVCAFSFERALIKYYGRESLANLTDGGEGGSNPSDETRALMSARKLGVAQSERHAEKSRTVKLGKKISDTSKFNLSKRRPVINSSGEIFDSASEAARVMSERLGSFASQGNISMCASGIRNNAYGFTWSYDVSDVPIFVETVYREKPVVCVEMSKEFRSVQDAAYWVRSYRGSANNQCISHAARSGTTAYGYKWRYKDEL